MADKRIDYEKMAVELATFLDGVPGWVWHENIESSLRAVATAAAEAQREAIEQPIVADIKATTRRSNNARYERARTSYETQRSALLRALAAVRATPLVTESESPDAN